MRDLFEKRALTEEEVKWYHETFWDLWYDEDTDLYYLMGLNMIPFVMIIMFLVGTFANIERMLMF